MTKEEENTTDYETDDSLDTVELNELQKTTQAYGGIERSSQKKPKPVKEHVEESVKEPVEESVVQVEPEVKPKPRGRPKKDPNEPPKQVEKRGRPKKSMVDNIPVMTSQPKVLEKIVYLAPDMVNGGFQRVQIKPLTKKNAKKIENELAVDEEELKEKTKFLRNTDGTKDKRQKKERTPAQIEATKKLVALRKKKLEDKRAQKAQEKETNDENLKETVKEAVVETITEPVDEVKKRMEERRRARAERQKSAPIDIPQRKGLTFD